MKHNLENDLGKLTKEKDALDQSIALVRIVSSMLEAKRREDFWLRIILILSILVNLLIACVFIEYESQFTTVTTTTTETTIEQDTGEGSGNNVYQAGENATYTQGVTEGVLTDAEADHTGENNSSSQPGAENFQ